MESQSLLRRLKIGSFAGFVATGPMTGVMELYRRCMPQARPDPFIPRQVAEGIARRAGFAPQVEGLGEPAWWAVTAATHFGFGAAAGALYGTIEPSLSQLGSEARRRPARHAQWRHMTRPALLGAGFGILVWATHYLVAFPALGLITPQGDKPIRKNTGLILSHLMWGVTTSLLYDFSRRRLLASPRQCHPMQL